MWFLILLLDWTCLGVKSKTHQLVLSDKTWMIVGHQLHHIWQWKKVLLVDTSKIQLITASTIKHLSYSEGLNRKSSTGFAIFVCVEDTTFTWCLKKKPFATLFYLWSWLCCICLFLRAILLQNLSKMLCTSQETPPIFIVTLINIALGENLHHMNEHIDTICHFV